MTDDMRAVRRCRKSKSGWNSGDIDELAQMFRAAMTWDGNHCSKSSRDHLIRHGYAFRLEGQTALTGRGKLAALFCWPMPRVWFRMWWRGGRSFPALFNRDDQRSATR